MHPPAWCLHLIGCSDVLVEGIQVDSDYSPRGDLRAYADNDDGIVVDSCENVVIRDSEIRTHDDSISIKSGKGSEAKRPTRNVRISNCVFRVGSGIAIGSEMSGGIENVVISDCRLFDCFSLFCLKTARSRGGYIRHISMRNCVLESRSSGVFSYRGHKGMIFMESAYKEAEPKPEMIPPEVSDVRLSDLRIDSPDRTAVYIHGFADRPFREIVRLSDLRIDSPDRTAVYIHGFADRPFREIVFSNVSYTCKGPNDIQNAEVIFELIPQERRANCNAGNGKADSAPLGEE